MALARLPSSVILRTPQYLRTARAATCQRCKAGPQDQSAVVPAFSLSTVAVLLSPTHAVLTFRKPGDNECLREIDDPAEAVRAFSAAVIAAVSSVVPSPFAP